MDADQRRELFETLLPKVEAEERDRGLDDEQIAANRRKLTQVLAEEGDKTNPYFADLEQTVETGLPSQALTNFRDSGIVRVASHGLVMRGAVLVICALLGYVGMPTGHNLAWEPGTRGLLYGIAFGIGVLVLAQVSLLRQRRR
jgi:hypothetical protein